MRQEAAEKSPVFIMDRFARDNRWQARQSSLPARQRYGFPRGQAFNAMPKQL